VQCRYESRLAGKMKLFEPSASEMFWPNTTATAEQWHRVEDLIHAGLD